MVKYSRSHTQKVDGSFVIVPFQKKRNKKSDEPFRLLDTMDLGIYFVIPLLVGLGFGIVLDAQLGTKPICIISGLLLGVSGSFFNLITIVRQFSKHA